jgi:hypothetical protein
MSQHPYGALLLGRDGSCLLRIGAERIRSATVERTHQESLIGDYQNADAF